MELFILFYPIILRRKLFWDHFRKLLGITEQPSFPTVPCHQIISVVTQQLNFVEYLFHAFGKQVSKWKRRYTVKKFYRVFLQSINIKLVLNQNDNPLSFSQHNCQSWRNSLRILKWRGFLKLVPKKYWEDIICYINLQLFGVHIDHHAEDRAANKRLFG